MKTLIKLLTINLPILIFVICAVTGITIFYSPVSFYNLTPGVSSYDPYNIHFIRDIGLVYLSSGLIGIYGLRIASVPLCIAAAAWSALHGLFHLHIWAQRSFPFDGLFLFDLGAVVMPPIIIILTIKIALSKK